MSMLTPQGLKGKQYRVTGNAYPRLGRPPKKSRKVIAVLAGLLALALIGLGGVQLYDIFRGKDKNSSAQACATPSGKPLAAPTPGATPGAPGAPAAPGAQGDPHAIPQAAAVTVNIYNATTKAGLAGRTAEEFKKRGFTIGKVGNAPAELDKKVPGTAQVIAGPAGAGAGTLVGSQIAGATVTADARTDATVDFVIGDSYNA
ncbi:LytR C-terminal domain-containing protein, partial [Streptomyces sp. FH025]|nr:LytR C-terminal domain-containing protein [Streptomyces sp. FH025]